MAVVKVPEAKVALSTASVYPESTATAFELAARLGYDGVEVMVWTDPVSQEDSKVRSKGRDISSSYPEAIPENE